MTMPFLSSDFFFLQIVKKNLLCVLKVIEKDSVEKQGKILNLSKRLKYCLSLIEKPLSLMQKK